MPQMGETVEYKIVSILATISLSHSCFWAAAEDAGYNWCVLWALLFIFLSIQFF
jgi:hypothetical protein